LVGNLMERYYLEDPVINRRAILKWITQKWYGMAQTGFFSLWKGTTGGLLYIWQWNFGFLKSVGKFLTHWGAISLSRGTLLHALSLQYLWENIKLMVTFFWTSEFDYIDMQCINQAKMYPTFLHSTYSVLWCSNLKNKITHKMQDENMTKLHKFLCL
jgi:hypothetical protein